MESKLNFMDKYTPLEREVYLASPPYLQTKILEMLDARIELAGTDGLTGLKNRKSLDFRLNYLKAEFDRNKKKYNVEESFDLVFFDIDHFKLINDNYGHSVGDDILKVYSKIMIDSKTRLSDSFYRYGGEEFIGLYTDSKLKFAYDSAEKLRKLFDENVLVIKNEEGICGVDKRKLKGNDYDVLSNVTSSFGIVNYKESFKDHNKVDFDNLLKFADDCLYNSKRNGRNIISYRMDDQILTDYSLIKN